MIVSLAMSAALATGCASMGISSGPSAVANLEATTGNTARGTVSFTQHGDKVRVIAQVSGLRAGADHGFHVHEKGDCSSGDGMSAGGHFNPAGKPHGSLASDHHAGDMPALMQALMEEVTRAELKAQGMSGKKERKKETN